MTAADHIRIAKRCREQRQPLPDETLAWLIVRAEIGCELIAGAVELAER